MVVTTSHWFGGGRRSDAVLNRRRTQDDQDTQLFHRVFEITCNRHAVADYPRYKQWCDEYSSSSIATSRAASAASSSTGCIRMKTRAAGTPISPSSRMSAAPSTSPTPRSYAAISITAMDRRRPRRTADSPWSLRGIQSSPRSRHIFRPEDRGNVESILSSLPPVVRWP